MSDFDSKDDRSSEQRPPSPAAPNPALSAQRPPAVGDGAPQPPGNGTRPKSDPSAEAVRVMQVWAESSAPTPQQKPPRQSTSGTAGNALILSREPGDADQDGLDDYRRTVKTYIERWGLGFKPATVTQFKENGKVAGVALEWPSEWGSPPVTKEIPSTMAPIDARAAVASVKQFQGWAKLEGKDQTIVENMLGGESNDLSSAARKYLLKQIKDLATRTAEQQATTLQGLTTNQKAIPDVVNEDVSTAKTPYRLSGPQAKKDHEFRGKKADAEEWLAAYDDSTKLSIIAPKAPEPGLHNHTAQESAEAASYLTKNARALIHTISLNPVTNPEDAHYAVEYKNPNFHSYMTAGVDGVIDIYPNSVDKDLPKDNYMRGTMFHEAGHTFSYKTWGEDTKQGKWALWKMAMDKDKVAVSQYAGKAIDEDVAETIAIYGTTKGTPRFDEYRSIVPNRFALLDEDYGK